MTCSGISGYRMSARAKDPLVSGRRRPVSVAKNGRALPSLRSIRTSSCSPGSENHHW